MPSINFPSGPSLNDTYNLGTRTWKWNGEAWALQPLTGGFTGSQGFIGYSGSKGTLEAASDNTLNDDTKVIFGDAGEHIYGDGTDLKIISSGNVSITGSLTLSSGVTNSTSIQIKDSSGNVLKTMYGTTS